MSIGKSVIYDNGMQRQVNPGDIVAASESILATQSATTITVTAAMLLAGIMLRNPAAGATDTIDSAANLIAGLSPQAGVGLPNGLTFRFRWIVTTAQATTVQATANTGVTVNRGAIAASSWKEFLVTIINGTPVQTLAGTTVNTSAVVSGLSQAHLSTLSVGMIVTNAVAGLQGTTVIAINLAAGTVTMSGNANATNATPVAITFSPVVQVDGLGQGGI